MRTQQEAERAEQQRIKSLVLNYDLTDDPHDGEEPAFHYIQTSNSDRTVLVSRGQLNKSLLPIYNGQSQRSTIPDEGRDSGADISISIESTVQRHDSFADNSGHIDHPHSQPRQDKSGNSRSKQRARKLQLGDIDWYGTCSHSAPQATQAGLDTFIRQKRSQSGSAARFGRHVRHQG
jgi:regulator of nonsense transcripts 2